MEWKLHKPTGDGEKDEADGVCTYEYFTRKVSIRAWVEQEILLK